MKKYIGSVLCGSLILLGGTAVAANDIVKQNNNSSVVNTAAGDKDNAAKKSLANEARQNETDKFNLLKEEFADSIVNETQDRANYLIFQDKLKAMEKRIKERKGSNKEMSRKLEQRKIMLDMWDTKQEALLNRLVEMQIEERLKTGKSGNSTALKLTPEQLARAEKKLARKTRALERELKKLSRQASRKGDYVEAIKAINGRVTQKKLELQQAAIEYAEIYALLKQESTKVGWTTGVDMQDLSIAGYLPLEGKLPKDMSRVEAAERVASLLKALENGLYPDIPDKNLQAVARLRTEFAKELHVMGYFDDEAAQIEAENQWSWASTIPKERRLRLNDEIRLDYRKNSGDISNDRHLRLRNRLYADYHLAGSWHAIAMVESTKYLIGDKSDSWLDLERYYVTGNIGVATLTAGVFGANMAEGNIYDSKFKGAMVEAGAPVHYAMRYGSVNNADKVFTITADYRDGKYKFDGGYHHFDMEGTGKRDIIYGDVHIPLAKRLDLGMMYLHGDDSTYGSGNGYVITLSNGHADRWREGNVASYLKYYDQPRSTYVQHGMNGIADSMNGFTGWGASLVHTIKSNVEATLEFDSLKEKETGRKNNTIWAAISYFFDL